MFKRIVGQQGALEYLTTISKTDTVYHAYVFVGPQGVGKRTVARTWVHALLSKDGARVDSDFFEITPDLLEQHKPIETTRLLNRFLSLSNGSARRAALVPLDLLHAQAQDALLKTIEEPRGSRLLILTARALQNVAPTIISRCAVVRFDLLSEQELLGGLQEWYPQGTTEHYQRAARFSHGSVARARVYMDDEEVVVEQQDAARELWRVWEKGAPERMRWIQKQFGSVKKISVKRDRAGQVLLSIERVLHERAKRLMPATASLQKALGRAHMQLSHNISPQAVIEELILSSH